MESFEKKTRDFEGNMVRFQTKEGEWRIGRVTKVTKDMVQIEELISKTNEGYGYGFWGPPTPFYGPVLFDLLFFV